MMILLFVQLSSVQTVPVLLKVQSKSLPHLAIQGHSQSMSGHDHDMERSEYFGALKEIVLKSVTNSLQRAVATLTERQNAIEKKTDEQLESFNSLLVPLRHAIQERFGSSSISSD